MSRPRLTVATSYPIHPPRGGGQQRIFELYRALAALGFEVEVVTLVDRSVRASRRELAPRLHEIRVPRTPEHEGREFALGQRTGVPAGDIALTLFHALTPAYGAAIAASARDAAAVVASHPFALPAIVAATPAPLVYEAHNVEADLKAAMFTAGAEDLVAAVAEVEAACCERAELVLACSSLDAERLRERYGVDPDRVALVPNGVDVGGRRFVDLAERRAGRARLGMLDGWQALFIGSFHEPNVVAARTILEAARLVPDTHFLIVGGVGGALARRDIPANVDSCGVVDAGFLEAVLALSDVALNPMRGGSGTNLKMLDYAASGVPLISSPVGARGLGFEAGVHYLPAEPEPAALAGALGMLAVEPEATVAARTRAARARTEDGFHWAAIAGRLAAHPWVRERAGAVVA